MLRGWRSCRSLATPRSARRTRDAGQLPPDARTIVQECDAGLVPLVLGPDGMISARVPRPTVLPFAEGAALLPLLGAAAADLRVVDLGPRWIVAAMASPETLAGLDPDLGAMTALSRRTDTTGVTVYALTETGVEVRSFAPLHGVPEDPVCGSGNAAVAAHLRVTGAIAHFGSGHYRARQGKTMGRDGEVAVALDGEDVTISGAAITVIAGTIRVP